MLKNDWAQSVDQSTDGNLEGGNHLTIRHIIYSRWVDEVFVISCIYKCSMKTKFKLSHHVWQCTFTHKYWVRSWLNLYNNFNIIIIQ